MEYLIYYLGIGLFFVIYSIQSIDFDLLVSKAKKKYKQISNEDDLQLSENTSKWIVIIITIIIYSIFWPIYLLKFFKKN